MLFFWKLGTCRFSGRRFSRLTVCMKCKHSPRYPVLPSARVERLSTHKWSKAMDSVSAAAVLSAVMSSPLLRKMESQSATTASIRSVLAAHRSRPSEVSALFVGSPYVGSPFRAYSVHTWYALAAPRNGSVHRTRADLARSGRAHPPLPILAATSKAHQTHLAQVPLRTGLIPKRVQQAAAARVQPSLPHRSRYPCLLNRGKFRRRTRRR